MSFIEICFVIFIGVFLSIVMTDCSSTSRNKFNKNMLKMNLAHYNQKTGEFVLDSLSCHNDTCIIIRK